MSNSEITADPIFDTARRHRDAIAGGVKITVAASVAFGLELNQLKIELGYVKGRPSEKRCNNSTFIPWKTLVTEQTGFSYERCQQFCKTAERVVEQIGASRAKSLAEVKLLVKNPPSEWTQADYFAFADAVGEHFDAATFNDLMIDVGVKKLPQPETGQPGTGDRHDAEQFEFPFAAMQAAHDCVAQPILGLFLTQQNPYQFTRHLYELPLEDQEADEAEGRPAITGLLKLRHILADAKTRIDEAIQDKRGGNK